MKFLPNSIEVKGDFLEGFHGKVQTTFISGGIRVGTGHGWGMGCVGEAESCTVVGIKSWFSCHLGGGKGKCGLRTSSSAEKARGIWV